MYEVDFIEHFKKVPVFSLSDVNQLIESKNYAKKFLKKMIKKDKVYKIKRDLYTLHNDPFLVACFIKKPSYISCLSALSYHKEITQIPGKVFCITTKDNYNIEFNEKIEFIKTNHFFGYNLEKYEKFKIPIADIEKAIIDSIGIVPLHLVEEAIPEINKKKIVDYLKKIKKSSTLKRIGYLMEKHGFDVYDELKKYINYKYIYLDPLENKNPEKQGKNKKWKIIINTV